MVNTTQTFLTGLVVVELLFSFLLVLPFGDNLKQSIVTAVDGVPALAFLRYAVYVIMLILIAMLISSQNDLSSLNETTTPQQLVQNVQLHREILVTPPPTFVLNSP